MDKVSVFVEGEKEAQKYKWIQSEKAGKDLGEAAIYQWVRDHWWGYLRARWIEHLQGKCFWMELDRNDFGLLQREFKDQEALLNGILNHVKSGKENLDILCWAHDYQAPIQQVMRILEAFDINSRRLACKFGAHL